MWVAVLTSYSGNGPRVDTPVCVGASPQEAVDYAKAGLMYLDHDAWDEVYDERLGRKILVRVVRRSNPKEIFEYGWLYAVDLPAASNDSPVDITAKGAAPDEKARQ